VEASSAPWLVTHLLLLLLFLRQEHQQAVHC
jgi:hypothetical protein